MKEFFNSLAYIINGIVDVLNNVQFLDIPLWQYVKTLFFMSIFIGIVRFVFYGKGEKT